MLLKQILRFYLAANKFELSQRQGITHTNAGKSGAICRLSTLLLFARLAKKGPNNASKLKTQLDMKLQNYGYA